MSNPNYTDFNFTANGIKFISRIYSDSPFLARISNLPSGVFEQLNQDAIRDIIGDPSLLSREELLSELDKVNAGGSHAFILLDEVAY